MIRHAHRQLTKQNARVFTGDTVKTLSKTFCSIAFLFSSGSALAQSEEGSWSYQYGESEGYHKLFFSRPNSDHGLLYFRCEPERGWVFLIPAETKPNLEYLILQSGGNALILPLLGKTDEATDEFYYDAALPTKHRVVSAFMEGEALRIGVQGNPLGAKSRSYPVRTEQERRSIRNFFLACGTD